MSLHLTLLPVGGINEQITSIHNFLNCERDIHLFEQIEQIIGSPVPKDFKGFHSTDDCDYSYGNLTKDAYGEELTYVFVKDLIKLRHHSESQTNKAIWAYLNQLPSDGKIALYWS
ncbi:MAG TPA: hypothetical protein PKY59_23030 [Pyrinomonadaceae bacterium]|nr:hypothetical protein [Pyrinomonadaceae bacterium]